MRNLVKFKRWEAGLKQYELAHLLGCSATYLSMVENGRITPTTEFIEKAVGIMGEPESVLFPASKKSSVKKQSKKC